MASFSPVYTIGNQITEAVRLHQPVGRREAWAKAIDQLQKVGVLTPSERMVTIPHELSGGLLQRAMIAMALVCQPSVLIADPPTTPPPTSPPRPKSWRSCATCGATRMAMIFITHDLGVVAQIADRVLVMYLGRAVEYAPVDEIFHAPNIRTRGPCCDRCPKRVMAMSRWRRLLAMCRIRETAPAAAHSTIAAATPWRQVRQV